MMIEIKYGGTGDTKTKFLEAVQRQLAKIVIEESQAHLIKEDSKNLDKVQASIIRGGQTRIPRTIDSNLVMSLINEVLAARAENYKVREFTLGEPDEFLLSSSLMDKMTSESREEAAKTQLDREVEVMSMREPEIPAVAKIPKMRKGRFKTKVKAKKSWLDNSGNRVWLVVFLLAIIGVACGVLLS